MLPNLGFGELLVIFVVVLLLFGAKRLPEVAKGLGRSMKAFKDGLREVTTEAEDVKHAVSQAKEETRALPQQGSSVETPSRSEEKHQPVPF